MMEVPLNPRGLGLWEGKWKANALLGLKIGGVNV